MKAVRSLWIVPSIAVAVAFVLLWKYAVDARMVSPVFLPSPERTWAALQHGFAAGALQLKFLHTLERMFYGWICASIFGIAIGALIGSSSTIRSYLQPSLELLRPLPASAVIPIAIAFFGLSDGMVLATICFGALWPMLLATIHGFSSVEPRLYELSEALGMKRTAVVFKIVLPSALPDILAGMRLGMTVSLILTVVGEMLASRDGLGQWILLAGRSFRSPDLFAGLVLLAALGLSSSLLLIGLERWLLRWRTVH
ncbi:ABC transporter permease [Bradyrhizobium mercantei]|uniref:ABC transporter permease n=1 Tax=Bradyrhizobium mercantei TaxID=1904807 RepID=UPI000977D219|nr:ABC transporter permease [Bradyrhizobium mercantei]